MASICPKLSELIAYNSRISFFCWHCSMKDSWDYFLGNRNMLSGGFSPFNYVQECKSGHFRPLVLTLGCSPSPCGPPLLPIAFTLIIVWRKRTAKHRQSNSLAGVDEHFIQYIGGIKWVGHVESNPRLSDKIQVIRRRRMAFNPKDRWTAQLVTLQSLTCESTLRNISWVRLRLYCWESFKIFQSNRFRPSIRHSNSWNW